MVKGVTRVIYVAGDIHGFVDIYKLNSKKFPEGNELSRDDYVIILGDFGLVWHDPPRKDELWWLKWLNDKPWTTLVVDGNHDNHDMILALPEKDFCGGKVGVIRENILHLRRGEVYEIEGKKILAFGGAESTDKETKVWKGGDKFKIVKRVEGKDWWSKELASDEQKENAWRNLEKNGNAVDVIVAHTLPRNVIATYDTFYGGPTGRIDDPVSSFLQEVIEKVDFKKFYCGHFHDDTVIDDKFYLLFDNLVLVE